MKTTIEKTIRITSDITCNSSVEWVESDKLAVCYKWDLLEKEDGKITLEFDIPCINMEFAWEPTCLMNRFLNRRFSSSAVGAVPVIVYCNNMGNSICAIALSEAVKKVDYDFGVVEETAMIKCKISVDLRQFGNSREFSYVLYFQCEEQPLSDACWNIQNWWDEWYPLQSFSLPVEVKEPVYSTWYSFHREITADSIIEECKKAKEYGMEMVFIDSGWHSEVNDRRFFICGDWNEFAVSKIPDMKLFVESLHKLGMKVVLWYSVAFVSDTTKAWKLFQNKLLMYNAKRKYAVLDPRYPDVREYLISHYVRALKEWNIDGFKLDFVDNFHLRKMDDKNEEMDIVCVEEAADKLMHDAVNALRSIKSDVITELRQGYVGPNMQQCASVFRAVDCPEDYRQNRVGIVDLRLLSRNVIVHSDMLMWNTEETPEGAARQILNVIFSVIQFSVQIDSMTKEQQKMVKFWLTFAKENKGLLIESKIQAFEPQNFYPIVKVENEKQAIVGVYVIDKVVAVKGLKQHMIINSTMSKSVILELKSEVNYQYVSFDCMGEKQMEGFINAGEKVIRLAVPESGLLVMSPTGDENKFGYF